MYVVYVHHPSPDKNVGKNILGIILDSRQSQSVIRKARDKTVNHKGKTETNIFNSQWKRNSKKINGCVVMCSNVASD